MPILTISTTTPAQVSHVVLALVAGTVLVALRRISYHTLCQLVPRLGFLVRMLDASCTSIVRALTILRLTVLRVSDADQQHLMDHLEQFGVLEKVLDTARAMQARPSSCVETISMLRTLLALRRSPAQHDARFAYTVLSLARVAWMRRRTSTRTRLVLLRMLSEAMTWGLPVVCTHINDIAHTIGCGVQQPLEVRRGIVHLYRTFVLNLGGPCPCSLRQGWPICSIMLSSCTQAFANTELIDFPLFAAAVHLCSAIVSAPCHRAVVTPRAHLRQRLFNGQSHFAFFLAYDRVAGERLHDLLRMLDD